LILSRYTMLLKDRKALKIIDQYSIHKAVYSLFPQQDTQSRDFLYCDKGGDARSTQILILSHRRPKQPLHGTLESREISDAFLQKKRYAFEVVVNPVKRENKSRKIVVMKTSAEQLDWFFQRAQRWGFQCMAAQTQVDKSGVVTFPKNGATCTLGYARIKGVLEVSDQKQFIHSFSKGLGRAKSFGFGLLQLFPINN